MFKTKILDKITKIKGKKKGFTLVELSIVMIIIALLVVGVVAAQSLIASAQLAKARSLTNSAPIATIEDLTLWLETTTEE